MTTSTYHCPSCSAPIAYKPEQQLFICDYCQSEYTPQAMEEYFAHQEQKAAERAAREIERQEKKAAANPEVTQVHEYNCNHCGAHVVTDETTTATFCYYCHSPVIINTRLQGDFRPDQMLPFRISESQAKQGFLDWTKTKKYLPPNFTSDAQLEKMTGIYIPYWFVDSDVDVDYSGTSRALRVWRVGNYQYTETTTYEHVRQGIFHLTDVNIAAFGKIDQNLLNGIEPYEYEDLQTFSMPMLSGFFAEQYTVDESEAAPVMERQVSELANEMLQRSLGFTANIKETHKQLNRKDKDWLYTLLPVWVLTYQYNGKTYVYAMNGQTGKAFGELPLVESKLNRDALMRGLLIGLIVAVVVFLMFWFFI